jgi:uncharacterized protein with HEPN domain
VSDTSLPDYLDHMLEAAQLVSSYVQPLGKDDFLADKRTQQAVIMNLVIIGEASAKLLQNSATFLDQYPEVPWRNMRGMRNRIAHGYFDIDLNVVWDTVQTALPDLLARLPVIAHAALEKATLAIDPNAQFKPGNPNVSHVGRVVVTTPLHCVQRVGPSEYVIHALSHPATEEVVDIRYVNGKPTIKAPNQDASPS